MPVMFLNGTAMAGQPDHGAHAGSTFLGPAMTASTYRFFAVRGEFPGLLPVARDGRSIVGELYDIPDDVLRGSLLPAEPPELEFGEITVLDGSTCHAMLLVPSRLSPTDDVTDISELGGFRSYQRFRRDNARIAELLGARGG